MPASCQYAHPVVDMPALWLIHPPPVDIPTLLHPPPVDTPALAIIFVAHGAADDVAGSMMPTSLKEGRGKECHQGGDSGQLAWLDAKCVFTSWALDGTCGWWEEQWQLYHHMGDKGYFKSQYIELVITFLILNQKICFLEH